MTEVGVINYGIGNLGSVSSALNQIGVSHFLIESSEDFDRASHIILPGVGAFGVGMENLKKRGFDKDLRRIVSQKKPLLGICLGMQLLASKGFEYGENEGLGFIPGKIVKLEVGDLRLPHVGWNDLKIIKANAVFKENLQGQSVYFVHSFQFIPDLDEDRSSTTDYGGDFTSCVSHDNVYGAQFHPEKSQKYGLQILKNFCELGVKAHA